MELMIGVLIGALVGSAMTLFVRKRECAGTINIAISDEDDPYLFLESKLSIDQLAKERFVVYDVKIIRPRK